MLKRTAINLIILLLVSAVAFAAPPSLGNLAGDVKTFDGKVGIYAKNLLTGRSVYVNEMQVFPAASTSKLVAALAVYKYLYSSAAPDKKALYDQDVQAMITVSDNDAYAELLAELDAYRPNALQQVCGDLRLKNTLIHSEAAFQRYGYHSVTTAYEMARVMETLFGDRYLGKKQSGDLKDELANTIYHDEIPRYMQTKVMHKVGELDNVLCDVGIIDDGKDLILVSVYTSSDRPDPYASDFIANASAKLYNLLRRK